MSEIPLNKFEKEKRVIEMHLEGKTIREISKEARMSFRDISKITKAYDKQIKLEERKKDFNKNNNNYDNKQIKRNSKSSRAYELLLKGKTPVEVAIELNLSFQETRKYWTEFLRLQNMKKL